MTGPTPPTVEEGMREAVAQTPAPYVLVKRGLYYMPDSCGYTGVLDKAGRYTEAQAHFHNDHCGEVKGILASEAPRFSEACWHETIIQTLQNDLSQAASALAARERERDEARGLAERLGFELEVVGTENDELEEQAEEDARTIATLRASAERMEAELKAAREFIARHPSLSQADRAEFRAFLALPAAVDALVEGRAP